MRLVLANLAETNIYSQKAWKMFIYGPIFKILSSTERWYITQYFYTRIRIKYVCQLLIGYHEQ